MQLLKGKTKPLVALVTSQNKQQEIHVSDFKPVLLLPSFNFILSQFEKRKLLFKTIHWPRSYLRLSAFN